MQLDQVLSVLISSYIPRDKHEVAQTKLTELIAEHGIKVVRKAIKITTGKPCPTIIYLEADNTYYFKKYCKEIILNTNTIWIFKLRNWNDISEWKYQGIDHKNRVIYTTPDEPLYNGSPLIIWINFGKECDECGHLHITAECPDCAHKYQIRSYNEKAEEYLGYETKKTSKYFTAPRFGIELEYNKVTAKEVYTLLKDHAIAKRDGSVPDGLEIVTKPAYMDTHKTCLTKFFAKATPESKANTGMHVHIEKEGLSQFQIGFITEFLNHTDLLKQNEKVAGREYSKNSYCKSNSELKMTTGLSYNFEIKKLTRWPGEKYTPVNTAKDKTIEIRIFSSPKTQEECFAKLDFVSALVQYSSPYSVQVRHLRDKFSWTEFTKYIESNKHEFKDFHNYFIKSGVLS